MANLTGSNSAALCLVPADCSGVVTAGSPAVQLLPLRTFSGGVDLTTLTYGGGGSLNGLTILAGGLTVTFGTPANAAAVVTAINAVLTGAAALNGSNQLVLTAKLSGGTALPVLGIGQPLRRIYTSGCTIQNTDVTSAAWVGPAGVAGSTAATPGYYLAPNGGSVTLPAVDITTLWAWSAGAPVINWLGIDLS